MDFYKYNLETLYDYFEKGCKKNGCQNLGIEIEHFIVDKNTKESISYEGENGVSHLLEKLLPVYEKGMYEDHRILGMSCKDYTVTLEPASQLEISIAPRSKIKDIEKVYKSFRKEIDPYLRENGYDLVTMGYQPKNTINELSMIPKKRYDYMYEYFRNSGTKGANMMKGTASTQISIDFFSEKDFVRKIRAAYILMPAIKFLTDNVSVFEGKRYEKRMARTMIWKNVDEKRCGVIPGLFDDDFGFLSYGKFIMELPPIFLPDHGNPVFTENKTVRQIWNSSRLGQEDIEHILSMAFPDVRAKQYLEIRGADSMPLPYVLGYAALVKAIFFHEEALEAVLEQKVTETMIYKAEESLMEKGYNGEIYGHPVYEYLTGLFNMAYNYLDEDERCFLEPFRNLVQEKRSLTDDYEK